MNLALSIQTALSNLRANKLRSALTMLGVIIGVSSVIVMVGIVEGARAQIVSEFQRLGSQLIFVGYGLTPEEAKHTTRRLDGMTMDDVRAIQSECSLVDSLSDEIDIGAGIPTRYLGRESRVTAQGVQPDYLRLRNFSVAEGRFFTTDDMEGWAKVCAIGATTRKELFPGEDPVGKTIDLQGLDLTVIAVLAKKGDVNDDKTVMIPITTVQKRIFGIERVGTIFAQTRDAAMVDPAMEQIWECLMRRYDNIPGFHVDSQENILNAIGRILTIFGLVLGGVAGLALLVGGIGIMNIMLVSVTERTREIGLRKAIGAKRRDILIQFVIESATLSGVGGLIGIGLGAGAAYALGAITKRLMPPNGPGGERGLSIHLPLWAILGAFFFAAFIGLFFGIYPAVRAARLDPIEALRHE